MSTVSKYGPLKRGDVDANTGLVFWAYAPRRNGGEDWLPPDAFAKRQAEAANQSLANRASRREAVRRHRERNREAINERSRKWRKENPDAARARDRRYNERGGKERQRRYRDALRKSGRVRKKDFCLSPEKRAERAKRKREWWAANREVINGKRREDRKVSPLIALKNRVRARTADAFKSKGYSKTSKTYALIGCGWGQLQAHIESQFVAGMSWDNRHLWHVDHIIPLASAGTHEEMIRLCHYTNLQPLWAFDNMSKGSTHPYELWQNTNAA